MEKNRYIKTLYNSAIWMVMGYYFSHPELSVRKVQVARALPGVSQSAVYAVMQTLANVGILTADREGVHFELNRHLPWVRHLMIADSLLQLQPLVDRLAPLSSRGVLFGSRACGEHASVSDFDVFVVGIADEVRRAVTRSALAERIQLLVKSSEEWLDLHRTDPPLYESILKGIVLWERR